MRSFRAFFPAALITAALVAGGPHASAGPLPDAEIFATDNTAIITDPADPRLDTDLAGFAADVQRIVQHRGGSAVSTQLLDGVFFSSSLNQTTFETSREFAVEHVTSTELRSIAQAVQRRFHQESVLTFDHLPPGSRRIDGLELRIPGVSAQALRDGLLADRTAREQLFGGSVTRDGELILIAGLDDRDLARSFASSIGGDLGRAVEAYGDVQFVG